jgi:AraC family transcriptional regulator
MFYASFGMTCADYVRQRRLTLAADEVLNSDDSIADIALRYGYESQNAFTRAFRAFHQINPSTVRANAGTHALMRRASFPKRGDIQEMDYTIVEKPNFKIVGKGASFKFDDFVADGQKFWKSYVKSPDYQSLYGLSGGMPGPITSAPMVSAYFPKEDGSRDEFTDVLALEATKGMDCSGFDVHSIPAATYAEFVCNYKSSMSTNRYIYRDWFSSTGYQRDGSKPDIAAYFPIPFKPMSEMTVRWWIPVVDCL